MFCNFCNCLDCQEGRVGLFHARTEQNTWICDTCYDYEMCLNDGMDEPCRGDCPHRPIIISEWSKYEVSGV